jgi:hypothetical protein
MIRPTKSHNEGSIEFSDDVISYAYARDLLCESSYDGWTCSLHKGHKGDHEGWPSHLVNRSRKPGRKWKKVTVRKSTSASRFVYVPRLSTSSVTLGSATTTWTDPQ